jgi:hypothetical protein
MLLSIAGVVLMGVAGWLRGALVHSFFLKILKVRLVCLRISKVKQRGGLGLEGWTAATEELAPQQAALETSIASA